MKIDTPLAAFVALSGASFASILYAANRPRGIIWTTESGEWRAMRRHCSPASACIVGFENLGASPVTVHRLLMEDGTPVRRYLLENGVTQAQMAAMDYRVPCTVAPGSEKNLVANRKWATGAEDTEHVLRVLAGRTLTAQYHPTEGSWLAKLGPWLATCYVEDSE